MMSTKVLNITILERKVLIVVDDMIADMIGNKKFHPKVIELFIRG